MNSHALKARRALVVALVLVAGPGALSSCLGPTEVDCTLLGCTSGLTVKFNHPLPPGSAVTLELISTPWRVECDVEVGCAGELFFEGLVLDELRVRVEWDNEVRVYTVRPEYVEVHANGVGCEPTCLNAEVLVELE